ncbi:uncharacterized protein LOC119735653 isoform X1 [Patiria miniata]|uniref:FAM234A/B beta-propeller domain-containing protein n=1 Tax=Patiria miniata TaxID=46514 RepID=A0A914AP34_PATMI|nr:uncharacterized protein LOC119735653 isoform X1 [Patiria miniata]XP_038065376.1 uncharacterized protein LOC119735653 isoform X1 [Patiria miniata]XP_038065377.1 uncharacterized protein LOC119735653 isoform X1 [Patiria miniata]XP_038065378.1 uncharacterized protein LOC119735653 isoform X1 [Patiria miniata]
MSRGHRCADADPKMSAEVKWPGFVSFGSMPYDDVYLEDGSSEEDEDEHVLSDSRKPLMSPQKQAKVALRQPPPTVGVHPLIKKRFLRWFYFLLTFMFLGLTVFVLIRIANDAMQQTVGGPTADPKPPTTSEHASEAAREKVILPCSRFDVQDVWVQNFPKLITETAFRLVDVNKDGVLDVIMGFSTGVTSQFADQYLVCDIYFNGSSPCFGGLMALDGQTGRQLWRHYSMYEIFAVNCNVDIDRDGVKDCLGGGRAGIFELVSGATGHLIWTFQNKELLVSISNFYTPQFIRDVDGDGVQDILNIHGGDPLRKRGHKVSHIGIVLIVSGASGHVITWIEVPDQQESYFSPQVYFQHGGREMVLFGSGGETKGGSLWVIAMADLLQGDNSKVTQIYSDSFKGVMTPPALVDITGDGVVDIVMAMFNSTVVAFDGQNYRQLWNYSIPDSETYSSPGVAYYNDDDVADFMVVYNHGPGYPVYYYSQVTILDGRTGQPLLTSPVQTAGSSHVSPLAVSMEGLGNDAFVYFVLDCLGHEAETSSYKFAKDDEEVGIGQLSRSNFCKQRFNTRDFSRLLLLNSHMTPPGEEIYNSLDRVADEYQYKLNSSLLAKAYLDEHPKVLDKVKELALDINHDHEQTGSPHSEERGDQHADGTVHSASRGGTDSVDSDGMQDLDEDDGLDQQDKPTTNKFAPRLGFDDEGEMPFFDPVQPIDDQPNPLPELVDSYERDPQQKYPQQVNSQDVDPLDFDLPDPYLQNPRQPFAESPLGSAPVPGEADVSDSGLSDQLLGDLLNKLLQEEQFGNLEDPPTKNWRGDSGSKGDLPQSFPRAGNSNWQYQSPQRNDQRKKPYFADVYDKDDDTDRREQYDRYDDKRGYADDRGPYSRYDNADREEAKELLDSLYGSSRGDFRSKRYFRMRRDADETPKQGHKPLSLPVEYLNKELFMKYESRDAEAKLLNKLLQERQFGSPGDARRNVYDKDDDTDRREQYDRYDDKRGYADGGGPYSRYDDMRRDADETLKRRRKSPSLPVEYLNNELFLKYESRETEPKELPDGEQSRSQQTANRVGPHRRSANHGQRNARHAGPHDAGGVQRLISTGTLAPVLLGREEIDDHSIDLIFATYWFYPSDTEIILPEQQKCIEEWMAKEAQRMNPKNVFYGLDHDAYEHMATDKCTEGSTRKQKEEYLSRLGPLDIYPFNIHTGEMTVYRLRLTCRCEATSEHQRCAKVLPYSDQRWAGYMGTYGNSHFRPFKR